MRKFWIRVNVKGVSLICRNELKIHTRQFLELKHSLNNGGVIDEIEKEKGSWFKLSLVSEVLGLILEYEIDWRFQVCL